MNKLLPIPGIADYARRLRSIAEALRASLPGSPAAPGGIHHFVVVVRDLEASLRFYRDGLGLDLLQGPAR